LETVQHLAHLTQPVMPDAMASLLDQSGQAKERRSFADLAEALQPGTALPKPEGVFPRYLDGTAA
jgi:methionyl-tRNA synthetase